MSRRIIGWSLARFRCTFRPVNHDLPPTPSPSNARSGRCAIIGKPNVGKSTLLNTLLGQKLVIATPRPGTTRTRTLGLYVQDAPPTQIAFVDTPGFERPRNAVGKVLLDEVHEALNDVDVVLCVVDASEKRSRRGPMAGAPRGRMDEAFGGGRLQDDAPWMGGDCTPDSPKTQARAAVPQRGQERGQEAEQMIWQACARSQTPIVLALNKADVRRDKGFLLPLLKHYERQHAFSAMVPISARTGDGLDVLVDALRGHLPEGLAYDGDSLTDRSERFFAGERIREAVFFETQQEVPYGVAVQLDAFEVEGGLVRITATIVVDRDGHKGIVIGRAGERLKAIGTRARIDLEEMLERKVFLKLWVKVIDGWTRHPDKARALVHGDAS